MRKTPVLSLLVVVWISIVWVGTQSSTSSPAAQVPMAEKTAGVGAAGTLAAPLLTGTIQILAYVQYADMSAGGEVAHTFSAISSVGTNYVRTDLTDYTQLASAIAGKNVLLIPEQERTSAAQLQTVGSAWASFLPSFVANGGVVIQCDHSGKYQILPSAGLMNITGSSNFYGGYPVTIADPSDPVALGVSPYTAENGSSTYVCSEGNVVVQRSSGNPVVINKRIGRGHVVAIGHDYYSSNANQDRVVGNAVFNLPQVLDPLWIQPWGDFISQGLEGGPFTPAETSYMAVNMSTRATLRWTASASQPWLDVAPGSGTLGPASLATVRVSINANANRLPMGVTTDTVTFTNLDSGLRQQRQVTLRVISHGSVASMPFLETFELGPPLAPYWEVTGTNEYRTQVTSLNGPHGGAYHLTMDDAVDGASYSRNELTLTINLARWQDVVLRFWAREWNDESHGPPSSPFVGGADFDGVAISDDGVNWYEVHGLRDLTSEYQQRTVDLDAAIAARGLSYNSAFRIRFNHYDDYGITTDGFAFDDIEITGNPADDLSLTPGIFVSSGSEGGPFTPAETTYMAVNMSTRATLRWTASQSQPWLNVAPGSGTLGPGSSASVRVSINANANSLPFGEHYGDISFTNVTSGFTQKRYAHLTIVPPNLVLSLADFAPTAPVQLRPGDLVTLSALIENHSLGGARSFWTEVWGSQTGGLTLDRFLADSFLLRGGLPPNGMHSWVGAARLYSIPDGSYTVVYHADRPNQVAESNERDNRAVVRGKRILVIRP
ncbi:hypothetical protein FJY63_00325, partial [Candidatus Sumerlaeota bacterium]|nr:hypothetical protein [Candidatus Sumerlaeota bacterium]